MKGSVGKFGGATSRICTKDIKINLIKKGREQIDTVRTTFA